MAIPRLTLPGQSLSPTSCFLLGTTVGLSLAYLIRAHSINHPPPSTIPGPPTPSSSPADRRQHQHHHPYPPDILPGRRSVPTPYGTINAYEFGDPKGEKVLLLPGIGTPVLALGDLAESLADKGYRVALFDYFGRGYSDAPADLPYDERLYATQVLLVLASSPLSWTGEGGGGGFHLVGYSLGGGLAAAFARWFPGMLRSLVLVAGAGLIRKDRHVGWRSRVLYSEGWLPEGLQEELVRRRIRPGRRPEGSTDEVDKEGSGDGKDSGANGGNGWDSAVLSKRRGDGGTVADVMEWQIAEHGGFVKAFMSSIRHAPIYDRRREWAELGRLLEERRNDRGVAGLRGGRVLLVVGSRDSVIVKNELVEDATAVLGSAGLEIVVIDAGHELVFTHAEEVADAAVGFWEGL